MITRRTLATFLLVLALAFCGSLGPSWAAIAPERTARFDGLIIQDPASRLGKLGERPDELPGYDAERAAWSALSSPDGRGWRAYVDRRPDDPLGRETLARILTATGQAEAVQR